MTDKELFQRIVGVCIQKKRMSQGLSQEELAEEIDMHPKHISNIERGNKCPSSYTLTLIQLVLNIDDEEYINEFIKQRSTQT